MSPEPRNEFDERLRAALRGDPVGASENFTTDVLRRLARRRGLRLPRPRVAALAAATALALAVGFVAWHGRDSTAGPDADAAARRQLIEEYRQIQSDLTEIRNQADDSRPVLYLGGDEQFDLVYDLESYESDQSGDVRAASLPDRG